MWALFYNIKIELILANYAETIIAQLNFNGPELVLTKIWENLKNHLAAILEKSLKYGLGPRQD